MISRDRWWHDEQLPAYIKESRLDGLRRAREIVVGLSVIPNPIISEIDAEIRKVEEGE